MCLLEFSVSGAKWADDVQRDELLVLIRRITYRMPGQIEFKDPAPIGISYDDCIFRVRLAHVFCISNFFSNSRRF